MSSTFYYSRLLFGPSSLSRLIRPLLTSAAGQSELLHPQSRIRDVQQISRDKFDRFPRATTEFTLCVLDRYGLRDHWPARPTLTPQIRFLYIGSRFCSTLPSDPASRRRPCASLSLHLYQVVKRTCTSKLSNVHGVPKRNGGVSRPLRSAQLRTLVYEIGELATVGVPVIE